MKTIASAALAYCMLLTAGCGTRTVTKTVTVPDTVSSGAAGGETSEHIRAIVRRVSPAIVTRFVQTPQGQAEFSAVA